MSIKARAVQKDWKPLKDELTTAVEEWQAQNLDKPLSLGKGHDDNWAEFFQTLGPPLNRESLARGGV